LANTDCVFFGERLIEQDSVVAPLADEPDKRLPPPLKRKRLLNPTFIAQR
jgi:hypothetical protein